MLERVFPSAADFTYRGSRIALWLLGLVLVLKLAIAFGAIFNGHYAATVADGIPIDSYTPQGAQAFLSLFASLGLSQFILGSLASCCCSNTARWSRFSCSCCLSSTSLARVSPGTSLSSVAVRRQEAQSTGPSSESWFWPVHFVHSVQ